MAADGGDPLDYRRVRVVEEDVQRVRREVGQVLSRQLLEARDECLWLLVRLDGVPVRLELVRARPRGENDLQEGVERREEHLEEQEPHVDGRRGDEEGGEERRVRDEERDEVEHDEEVEHREGERLLDVAALLVAHLVREDGDQLRQCGLRDQCVEESDALRRAEACEESVRVIAPRRAVDLENAAKGEAHLGCVLMNRTLERPVLERSKGDEERHDARWGYEQKQQLEGSERQPNPQPSRIAGEGEESKHRRPHRRAEHECEHQPLDPVHDERAHGRVVEAEARLQHEGGVHRVRQVENRREAGECAPVENSARDDGPRVVGGEDAADEHVEPLEEPEREPREQQEQQIEGRA
mmetsp:Transcript_32209/g.80221  ORF Transcript_32209/g.80221 Transcript_32209/m.80221 type:complete len:354 (+) Transcript_32209:389-1450(+)